MGTAEEQLPCPELLESLDLSLEDLCEEINSCEEFCVHSEFCLERYCGSDFIADERCVENCAQFGEIWQSFDLACDSMIAMAELQYPDFAEQCPSPPLCNGLCDRVIECTEGCPDFDVGEWTQICTEQCGLFESVEIPESCWEVREIIAPFISGLEDCRSDP